ncbi:hypothetical protein TMatcc_008075 [Talaromyces marneffei ATCC 18224]
MYISVLARTHRKRGKERVKRATLQPKQDTVKKNHTSAYILNLYGNLCYLITRLYADSNRYR